MTARIHHPCGQPMTASRFSNTAPIPNYRSQPIWLCTRCESWEPGEDWQNEPPKGWDGQAWTSESEETS